MRDVPVPEIQPDEVLLRVRLVGLCGSDLNTFRGRNPLVTLPRIPGHEVAATIERAGDAVPAEWHMGINVTLSPYTSCGRCTACISVCPANAVRKETADFSLEACYEKLTEFTHIPFVGQHICGVCVKACAPDNPGRAVDAEGNPRDL